MGSMIILAFLTLFTYSCAAESDKHKRSIFGEQYHGGLTNKKFTLGNIVHLGQHIEPFTASEAITLTNSYPHSNLHLHENNFPSSYQNTIQENTYKFLPVESSLIPEHKEEFLVSYFEKKAPLEHFLTNEKFSPQLENYLEPYHDDPVKPPPENETPPLRNLVTVGSGSLGATKLPNGQIVIGSGSLGYSGANSNNNIRQNNANENNYLDAKNQLGPNFVPIQQNAYSRELFKSSLQETFPQGGFNTGFPYFTH